VAFLFFWEEDLYVGLLNSNVVVCMGWSVKSVESIGDKKGIGEEKDKK
jgi:hypothetical protein